MSFFFEKSEEFFSIWDCNPLVHTIVFMKKLLQNEIWFFKHFRTLNADFLCFCWNFSDGVVKTALHLSIETLWWIVNEFFFEKKWRIFLNFFRPGAKIFWPSFLNNSAGCLTWILRVQKEHFEEEKVFLEKYRFCEVFEFWAKHFLCLLSKKCRWGCQTWIYISMRFFEGTKTSKNVFFYHFWTLIKKFPAFCPNFFSWVFETAIYLSTGSFWCKNFPRGKYDFSIFLNINGRVSVFFVETFLTVL